MQKKKIKKEENIKVKVVLYFLVGFFLNLLGLLVGTIWIKFKAKTYRKNKFIALLIGFSTCLIYFFIISPFVLQPLIQPQIDKTFFEKYPEAKDVTDTIQQKYPDAKIFVRVDQKIFSMNGIKTTTTIFSVQYRSKKLLLTGKQMQDIAKQTCSILESKGKSYDKILILSLKYTLPFKLAEVHRGIQKPCKDWETNDFSNVTFP